MKNKFLTKKLLQVSILIGIAFLLLNNLYKIFSFKYGDGILGLQKFYKLNEQTVDVLVLGSSHAFENINTGFLFDSYGIAAYVLSGSVQPYWNTYYYLVEALKTQRSKLIVLDAYASTFDSEYSDYSRIIKNNFGIKSLDTLYNSLKVSSPPETIDNYWFNYLLWHSRYTELSDADFKEFYQIPMYQYFRGFGINFVTQKMEISTAAITPPIKAMPLSLKSEEYYRKIIELSISERIPLLIVVSPFMVTEKEQMQFVESELIASEYGIDFINFNNLESYKLMDLNFDTDFADSQHLNYIGNVKYSNVIAKIITEKYDIPDRRDDILYEEWKLHSKDIKSRTYNQYLREESDFAKYFHKLCNEDSDYTIIIMTISNTKNIEQYMEELSMLGINADEMQDGSLYVVKNGIINHQTDEICWDYKELLDNNTLEIKKETKFDKNTFLITHNLLWNDYEYVTTDKGIYFFVYDNFSKELADVCYFYNDIDSNAIVKGHR